VIYVTPMSSYFDYAFNPRQYAITEERRRKPFQSKVTVFWEAHHHPIEGCLDTEVTSITQPSKNENDCIFGHKLEKNP